MGLIAGKLGNDPVTTIIPGAGHLLDIDAPHEAAAIITRFLRE